MAAKWRVWNRHPEGMTHIEKFRDQMVEIKANQYVLMDYEDAVQFKGQYTPVLKNAQGAPDPKGFKVIHLEPHTGNAGKKDEPTIQKFICHYDGAEFTSQADLDAHIKANYSDQIIVDETAEEEIKVEKRGRGRPPKEQSA